MKIDDQTVVTLSYELFIVESSGDTKSIEKRNEHNPVEFVYGRGILLPAVEKELKGKTAGYKKSLQLRGDEAYGDWHPHLEKWIEISKFPKNIDLKIGMKFQTQGPDGDLLSVIVKQIKDKEVLLDGNHPLAGLDIQFDFEIIRVRLATEQELSTGEVHRHLH